jgi:putative hydrolase of the HAD superfamily
LPEISAIFWDLGGVLLSNAWDHSERHRTLERFGLDEAEFEARHAQVVSEFEKGKITVDEYLEHTVFYRERPFTPQAFRDLMFSMSEPKPEALLLARALAQSGRYLMATINNESRELNLYRLKRFRLTEIFALFVSSCFVGLEKPEPAIYQLALDLVQKKPEECCFIDDRAANLEPARQLGIHPIEMQNWEQLGRDLKNIGVKI